VQITASHYPSKRRGNILSAVLIVVCLGAIAGLVFTMMSNISCPDELIGSWTTTAQGYEGKGLSFTKKGVVFIAGEDAVEGKAIQRVEASSDGSQTSYTIAYGASRRDEQILSFYYHLRTRTITFKNQPHLVWTRKTVES
jgi:hypothetical protein